MQTRVMTERNMLLMGVFPPVDALTLLLPYPPNAGSAMKMPPTTLAVPSATNSRFGLRFMLWICDPVFSPTPRLLAATDDSKNPSRAMMKLVLNASDAYLRLLV